MNKKTLLIKGKPYEVNYTFGAYVQMHEKHGINVFDLPSPTPRMIAVLIWGAIIHIDPQITPGEIAGQITMKEAMDGNILCIAAILESLPRKVKTDENVTGEEKSA